MLKSAATLEDRGQLGLAAESERVKPGAGVMRFAYATGSRPLEGYTIKRGVGVGGFGEVYFAISDAGKEVAIKRIQRNLDVEIRGVSHCLNLKHPNLVAIYDIRYDDEGQAWVVMEYVRGESLKDVIDRYPQGMPAAEALAWFRGIASGVAYLHDHGIVHRDLKPGNVFLDEAVVKIGDYGLSKYISCSRRSGQTESVGTFHYMAPEIGRGVYGKEIDVYALGIILYEMLTGRVPFEGESSHEIIMKHLTAAPDVTPLPEQLRPIVQRALFKDPEKRFRNVAELAAAVETSLGSVPSRPFFVAAHVAEPVLASRQADSQPLYIGPTTEPEEMYFGPVVVNAEPVPSPSRVPAVIPPEPIAQGVRLGWARFLTWWNSSQLNRPLRIVFAVLFVVLFVANAGWIVPVGIVLGAMYLVYLGIRTIVLALSEPSRATVPAAAPLPPRPAVVATPVAMPVAASRPVAEPVIPVARPNGGRRRRKWQELACENLCRKSPGERLMELTGSMLMSGVVVAVVTSLLLMVSGQPLDNSVMAWTQFAWLGLTSLFGTWAVMVPAKAWEGSEGDAVRRRFLHVVLGLFVGLTAFGLDQFLGVRLSGFRPLDLPQAWDVPRTVFASDGSPRLPAYLVYFAGLFLAIRWWQQTSPLRSARFNFWTCLGTVLVAGLWQIFWPFPEPWGLMVAATMSIALQVSAPWINSAARNEYRKLAEA